VQTDYARTTKATTLAELPPPIRDAIATLAEARMLTIEPSAPAFVTHSTRLRRPGLLARMIGTADKDAEHDTAFALGPRDLLVCTRGEQRGTIVLTTRLEDLTVEELSVAPAGDGVSVGGFNGSVEGEARVASFYIGLGPPDGDAAQQALREAVRAEGHLGQRAAAHQCELLRPRQLLDPPFE
jgi:hypothetical protein